MNGADLIAEILKREGVKILPAFPNTARTSLNLFIDRERYGTFG